MTFDNVQNMCRHTPRPTGRFGRVVTKRLLTGVRSCLLHVVWSTVTPTNVLHRTSWRHKWNRYRVCTATDVRSLWTPRLLFSSKKDIYLLLIFQSVIAKLMQFRTMTQSLSTSVSNIITLTNDVHCVHKLTPVLYCRSFTNNTQLINKHTCHTGT